jgi:hypothetical protein
VLETLIRCTCFISFTLANQATDLSTNHIERFMCIANDKIDKTPDNKDNNNLKKIDLNLFIKYLKKIVERTPNEEYPKVLNEILSDYGICHLMFEKFESYVNLFFSNK